MKRIIGALLLTLGLVAGPIATVNAAAPDRDSVRGRPGGCADITADAVYADRFPFDAGTPQFAPTVFGDLFTEQPSCVGATYTLSVYSTGTTPALLGEISVQGDGVTSAWSAQDGNALTVVPSGSHSIVCVHFRSSVDGRTVDQAPDGADGLCSIGSQRNLNGGTGASGMR